MSNLSLRLPDSLHAKIRELAERENVSINQFIALAAAEKAAALLTVEYLEERATRADDKILDRLLKRVPDVPAAPGDEFPEEPVDKTIRTTRSSKKSNRIPVPRKKHPSRHG